MLTLRSSKKDEDMASYSKGYEAEFTSSDDISSDDSDISYDDEITWQQEAMRSGELFHLCEKENPKTNKERIRKTVFIKVQSSGSYGKKLSNDLLANMLGIISLKKRPNSTKVSEKIFVDALVPGGAAYKTGLVKLGDILLNVGDTNVTLSQIDDILSQIKQTSHLKLTFSSNLDDVPLIFDPDLKLNPISSRPISEVKLISPSDEPNPLPHLNFPHALFYLKINITSDDSEDTDIIYHYPPISTSLTNIRGIFLTLSDITKENFNNHPMTSSLCIDDVIIHCIYHRQGDELLVTCFPAPLFTLPQSRQTHDDVIKLMTSMYGSLKSAFDNRNLLRNNHLLHYIFLLHASPTKSQGALLKHQYLPWRFPGVQMIKLPAEADCLARSALTEFESNDLVDGFDPQACYKRRFVVLSSCLFYNGYLTTNHMSQSDLDHITRFCFNHGLLSCGPQIDLLVMWREVFRTTSSVQRIKPVFRTTMGRTFWLVVGCGDGLLCSVVQMNKSVYPRDHTPRPPPTLVTAAQAPLLQLAASPRFIEAVRELMTSSSQPPVTCVDRFMVHSSTGPQTKTFRFSLSLKDETKKIFRERSFSSQGSTSEDPIPETSSLYRYLTVGDDKNRLFCFIDYRNGTFSAPILHDLKITDSFLQRKLLKNFQKISLLIHQHLSSSEGCDEEGFRLKMFNSSAGDELPDSFVEVWICGRLVGPGRELFVCFSDSTDQNFIEMTFRILTH